MRSMFPRLYDLAKCHRVGKTVMTYTGVGALELGDERIFWKLLVYFSCSSFLRYLWSSRHKLSIVFDRETVLLKVLGLKSHNPLVGLPCFLYCSGKDTADLGETASCLSLKVDRFLPNLKPNVLYRKYVDTELFY